MTPGTPMAAMQGSIAPLNPSDRTVILDLNPDGKIEAVDVERDLYVLMVQMRSRGIVKARYFATR